MPTRKSLTHGGGAVFDMTILVAVSILQLIAVAHWYTLQNFQNLQRQLDDFDKRSIALYLCRTRGYAGQVLQPYRHAHKQ